MSEFLPINLPSKCLPYNVNSEDVTVRAYQAKDEIYLAEINPINLESKYYQVLKNVVQGIDVKLLTLGDRLYIMIWECINSYTEIIKLKTVCTHCLEEIDISVNLIELNSIELPSDFKQPYSVSLPQSEKKVNLRLFTVGDELEIEKFEKKNQRPRYRFARSVVSDLNILDRLEEIEKLGMKDFSRIRAFHEKFNHGPDLNTTFVCPKCGEEDDVEVPFRLDFLYPYGEALTDAFGEGL